MHLVSADWGSEIIAIQVRLGLSSSIVAFAHVPPRLDSRHSFALDSLLNREINLSRPWTKNYLLPFSALHAVDFCSTR
jgi:hypothetical protein